MTIDFWGLGLQAVNVLILVWLLSRVFWRPVSEAIAKRQETAQTLIISAQATQARADAALADMIKARADMAAERDKLLVTARAEAESAANALLSEARAEADTLLSDATATIAKDAETARTANGHAAAALALTIAGRLLERMAGHAVQMDFLPQLIDAINKMPTEERKALADDPEGIEIVAAREPDPGKGAAKEQITDAVRKALGGPVEIRFAQDPDLIAGLELRSPHFVLRNSWQADLAQIRNGVSDAA